MAPRVLIVYYSRSGNTRQIGRELGGLLHADIDEIVDFDRRSGVLGYLRSGRQAFWRRIVPVKPSPYRPEECDLIVVGTPIWNVSVSAPVRSYLRSHRREIKAVAFFCTCGGVGMERTFQQMSEECGQVPVARLVVFERLIGSEIVRRQMVEFAEQVQLTLVSAQQARHRRRA